MMFGLSQEWLTVIAFALNVAATWGIIKTELRYMRRDINAAHRRLDAIKAPAAWVDEPG
jgi:hypothetical protein